MTKYTFFTNFILFFVSVRPSPPNSRWSKFHDIRQLIESAHVLVRVNESCEPQKRTVTKWDIKINTQLKNEHSCWLSFSRINVNVIRLKLRNAHTEMAATAYAFSMCSASKRIWRRKRLEKERKRMRRSIVGLIRTRSNQRLSHDICSVVHPTRFTRLHFSSCLLTTTYRIASEVTICVHGMAYGFQYFYLLFRRCAVLILFLFTYCLLPLCVVSNNGKQHTLTLSHTLIQTNSPMKNKQQTQSVGLHSKWIRLLFILYSM